MSHHGYPSLEVLVPRESLPVWRADALESASAKAQEYANGNGKADVRIIPAETCQVQAYSDGLPDDDAHEEMKEILFNSFCANFDVRVTDRRSGKEYEMRVRCDHQ